MVMVVVVDLGERTDGPDNQNHGNKRRCYESECALSTGVQRGTDPLFSLGRGKVRGSPSSLSATI